ncbi:MAG: thiamine-phosphate kinase [Candidatus Omnitrophica bacterium]|nr:thiamine-phosphate kinase [Candidatus Omnitrophota bacterium]
MRNLSQLGEFGLIDVLKKYAPISKEVKKGIGDDAAVLAYNKKDYLLLTTDMLAEDVHFTRQMSAKGIGHKALACSISDIAAMGGWPTFAVVSLGVSSQESVDFIKNIYQGIEKIARAYHVSVVGGDTIKTEKMIINVALLGQVEKTSLTTRDGARCGDRLFVTGPLGGSLKSSHHLNFMPRLEQARFLVKHFKPSAMMDISDGLSGDLNHILKASGVGVCLDEDMIPRNKGVGLEQALNEGEDFELLFTIEPKKARRLMDWQARNKVFYFYPIGTITSHAHERPRSKSFSHF